MGVIKEKLAEAVEQALSEYGLVIAILLIGMFIGWYGKALIADRRYIKQINLRIEERDERIKELNCIVLRNLNNIKVEKKDANFIKYLKRFFKKNAGK